MFDLKVIHSVLDQLEEERGIPKDKVIEAIEMALATAYKKEHGKRGQIVRAKFDLNTGKMHLGRNGVATAETEDFSPQRDHFYQVEHQAFLDAIAGKRTPESPAEDALISMKVVTAAMESIHSRQRIALQSI